MEEKTCMEYLFHSVQNNHSSNINQNILLNASNEFRNVWNLVKKLRDLARVDVRIITRFLDTVQEGLENKCWSAATRQCLQAENEYRHIKRYIRPSFLEDFKVSLYIENVDPSGKTKSATKREKKPPSPSVNAPRRPNFRNKQINQQKPIGDIRGAVLKKPDFEKTDVKKQKEINNKAKSKLEGNENTPCTDESSKLMKNATGELSSGNTVKGNKNSDALKESSSVKEKAVDEISSGNTLRGNENSNELNESSKLKENAVADELTSENTRKTTESVNSDNIKEESNKPNIGYGLTSDDMSPVAKIGVNRTNDDVVKNVQSINTTSESETVPNEQEGKIESVSERANLNGEPRDEDVLKSIGEEKMKQDDSILEKDKELDKDILNDNHGTTKHGDENTCLAADPADEHYSTNNGIVQNGELNKDDHLSDRTDEDSKEAVKHNTNDISNLLSERMTEISCECKPEEIVTELNHVYDTEWSMAYQALTGCKPSNGMKNTIDFLGEILKLSAEDVGKSSEMIYLRFQNDTIVDLLQKLKQEFLTQHLKELQKEHSIEYHNGMDDEYIINLYSAKCVELSLFMLTRKPPMVFDYDSRPMVLEDLLEIFKPYKNKGHCIHYVVWPAIRRCQSGTVVSQGIAEFR